MNQTCTYTESKRRGLPPGYVMHLETYIKSIELALGYALKEKSELADVLSTAMAKASSVGELETADSQAQETYRTAWKSSDAFGQVQKMGQVLGASASGGPAGNLLPTAPMPSMPSASSLDSVAGTQLSVQAPANISDFGVYLPRVAVSRFPQYYGPSSIYEKSTKPFSLSLVLKPPTQPVSQLPATGLPNYVKPAFEWLKTIPLSTKIELANYYFFFIHGWMPIVDRDLILDLIKLTSQPQLPTKKSRELLMDSANIALITNVMALSMQMKQNQVKTEASHNDPNNTAKNTDRNPQGSDVASNDGIDPHISTPSNTLIALCASVLPSYLADTSSSGHQELLIIQARLLYILLLLRKGFNSDAWTETGTCIRSAFTLGIHVFGVEGDEDDSSSTSNEKAGKTGHKVKIKTELDLEPTLTTHSSGPAKSPLGRTSLGSAVTPPSEWTKRTWFACCIMDVLVAAFVGRLPTVQDCDFEVSTMCNVRDAWEEWYVMSDLCPSDDPSEERVYMPKKPREIFSEDGKLLVQDIEPSDLSVEVYGPTQAAWLSRPLRGITVYNSLFKLARLLNLFLYRVNQPGNAPGKPDSLPTAPYHGRRNREYGGNFEYLRDDSDNESDYMSKPSYAMQGEAMRNDLAQRVHNWSQKNLHTLCQKDVLTSGMDDCETCPNSSHPSHPHSHEGDNQTSPDMSLACNSAHTVVMSPHALNLHLTFSAFLALMIRFDTISVLDCYDSSLPYASLLMPAANDSMSGIGSNPGLAGGAMNGGFNAPMGPGGFGTDSANTGTEGVFNALNENLNNSLNNFANHFGEQNDSNFTNGFGDNTGSATGPAAALEQEFSFGAEGFNLTYTDPYSGGIPSSPANSTGSGSSSWSAGWNSQPVYILPHSLSRHVTMKLTGYARFYTVHASPPFFAYYSALALALAVDQIKSVAQSVAQSAQLQRQQQMVKMGINVPEPGRGFGGSNGNASDSFNNGAEVPTANSVIDMSYLQSEMSLVAGLIAITQSYYWVDSTWNLDGGGIRIETSEIHKRRQQVEKILSKLKKSLVKSNISVSSNPIINRAGARFAPINGSPRAPFNDTSNNSNRNVGASANSACDNLININNNAALAMSLMGGMNKPSMQTSSSVSSTNSNTNNSSPNTNSSVISSGNDVSPSGLNHSNGGQPANDALFGNSMYRGQQGQQQQERGSNSSSFFNMLEAAVVSARANQQTTQSSHRLNSQQPNMNLVMNMNMNGFNSSNASLNSQHSNNIVNNMMMNTMNNDDGNGESSNDSGASDEVSNSIPEFLQNLGVLTG